MRESIGDWWIDAINVQRFVIAARELHVLYESEGMPEESFVAAMRYVRREGKALVLEQRLLEAETARPIARAWVVQLLVQDGAVVEWPARYVARVEAIEQCSLPARSRGNVARWGPPD